MPARQERAKKMRFIGESAVLSRARCKATSAGSGLWWPGQAEV